MKLIIWLHTKQRRPEGKEGTINSLLNALFILQSRFRNVGSQLGTQMWGRTAGLLAVTPARGWGWGTLTPLCVWSEHSENDYGRPTPPALLISQNERCLHLRCHLLAGQGLHDGEGKLEAGSRPPAGEDQPVPLHSTL